MKLLRAPIKRVEKVAKDIYRLSFTSPYIAKRSSPGHFLHVRIAHTILRRPFSINKVEGNDVFILFKVRGRGTHILSEYEKGDSLDILGPLGNSFTIEKNIFPILVAGGIGIAPLLYLAQRLNRDGKRKNKGWLFLGVKRKDEVILRSEFVKLGFRVFIATQDGSVGFRGVVTELLERELKYFQFSTLPKIYACGPKDMVYNLREILKEYPSVEGEVSWEQFMGCGLGICLGCVVATKKGYKKLCTEGPVFSIRDVF